MQQRSMPVIVWYSPAQTRHSVYQNQTADRQADLEPQQQLCMLVQQRTCQYQYYGCDHV